MALKLLLDFCNLSQKKKKKTRQVPINRVAQFNALNLFFFYQFNLKPCNQMFRV